MSYFESLTVWNAKRDGFILQDKRRDWAADRGVLLPDQQTLEESKQTAGLFLFYTCSSFKVVPGGVVRDKEGEVGQGREGRGK